MDLKPIRIHADSIWRSFTLVTEIRLVDPNRDGPNAYQR